MTRILFIAKAPVPGLTKTRLLLTPESAARLQSALIGDAVEKACALGLGSVSVAGTPADSLELIEPLIPTGTDLFAQGEGDLGERMLDAASRLYLRSPEPVLILGTDAPTLPPGEILTAAHALQTHDACMVGSDDGGYILLGLREPYESLFHNITWSTGTVYRETVQRAADAGLSLHEGERCHDVDTPEDLVRLREELRREPRLAPRTAGVLEEIQP